jgi:Uma2 family endonuclease
MVGDAGILTKRNPATTRAADVIAISFERYGRIAPERKGKVVDLGPELIVEVVSPSNTWDDIQAKLAEYFALGTKEVWVVGPNQKAITAYTAIDQPRVFTADKDDRVTSSQMPGFELPVGEMGALIDKLQAS